MPLDALRALRDWQAADANDKAVLGYGLVLRCDAHGRCWPSLPTIARDAGVSESTARRVLHRAIVNPDCPIEIRLKRRWEAGRVGLASTLYTLRLRTPCHADTGCHADTPTPCQPDTTPLPQGQEPPVSLTPYLLTKVPTEVGTEVREREPASGAALGATPTRARKQTGAALPSDFAPAAEHFDLGAELGFTRAEVKSKAAAFCDRVRDSGRTSHDWSAAFCNWLRGAPTRKAKARELPKQGGDFVDNSIRAEDLPPMEARS